MECNDDSNDEVRLLGPYRKRPTDAEVSFIPNVKLYSNFDLQ
jgi:hypothetical protein